MEEIGKLIGKGFGIWKKNLNLCIPFICSGFASILIVAAFFIAMFLAVMPFMDEDWTHVEDLEDSGLIEELFAGMDLLFWLLIVTVIITKFVMRVVIINVFISTTTCFH